MVETGDGGNWLIVEMMEMAGTNIQNKKKHIQQSANEAMMGGGGGAPIVQLIVGHFS